MYVGEGKIIGFDGVFSVAHGNSSSTNWDEWDDIPAGTGFRDRPDRLNASTVGAGIRNQRSHSVDTSKAKPAQLSIRPAIVLDSSEPGGPVVNLLTRDQSVTWFFKTREGAEGVLQLVSFPTDPAAAKIRYKLIQHTNGAKFIAPVQTDNPSDETFEVRLEAASVMSDFTAKDSALGALAVDAAKAGNPKAASDSLKKMADFTARSQAALGAVRELAKRGLRKPAFEIANSIPDFTIRDQALSELARQ